MDETEFEGTLVLEQLAEIGMVDEFFDAVDADDIPRAVALMRRARIDAETISIVVKKIEAADGQH
ncbi:MAG: hypothetical protein IPQ07_41465 [Myxococcales bacterium]|nr:hypothetical protein [Myxococcales bacterium]MBL0220326.1 hypothetical protein [Myxococcales bacterium]